MSNNRAINFIISALFRDGKFHSLKEKDGGEFYIDVLDEILANDVEVDNLLKEKINDPKEDTIKELSRISKPYLEEIKNKLNELEKDRWIKIEKINLEVFETGKEEKTLIDGYVIPEGKLLTLIVKIKAKEINWVKFIEYITDEYEKVKLDWDNIYSPGKQEYLIIQKIDKRRKDLDKDDDIVLQLKREDYEDNRIQILKTLEKLEKDGFIIINGFKIYEPRDDFEKIVKKMDEMIRRSSKLGIIENQPRALKAKISVTHKFRERIEKNESELLENSMNKKGVKLNHKNSKFEIIINSQKGIYDAAHSDRIYEISGKRLKIVEYLYKNNLASLSDLTAHIGQADSLVVKEIKEINNNFKKLLQAKSDLIIHSKTSRGYRLNKDNLEVKTSS